MRTPLLLGLIAACSTRPATAPRTSTTVEPTPAVAAPVAPADAAAPVAPADAAVLVAEPPHRCQRSVWPSYDRNAAEADPADAPPPGEAFEAMDEAGGGMTLDDKLAALNKRRPSGGVCDTRHRDHLEATILRQPTRAAATTAVQAWDRTTPPAHRDLVTRVLALTPTELQQLARDGLVVPDRLGYDDYVRAYYDIHRGQLPVYVTVDSILHAVYASHDHFLAQVERGGLISRLDAALGAMHCGLAAAAPSYPPEVAADLDLYLTVARSLLAGERVHSELGGTTPRDAAALLDAITDAGPLRTVRLFGRERSFDANQFTPRGHYASSSELENYFRAAMWLSRVELNLVSRDSRSSQPGDTPDPRETPHEAAVALALADLAQATGALRDLDAVDRAWGAFAGRREDVALRELLALRKRAGIGRIDTASAPAALRAAIGDRFVRTVNVHPMPNVPNLPVIATVLGPRITPDTVALGELIAERGPDHEAAELGFMLGHDRALAHLPPEPRLRTRLDTARAQLAAAPGGSDLYTPWLAAIRALAERPAGTLPSFMETPAFADLRLASALAAYGQLRHNHVLVAAQAYDQGGCEIPDGYVEPAPATYHALADYARRGRAVFATLDPKHTSGAKTYYTRLERLMKVLEALSHEQLANRPLSAAARRFLAMIVERRVATAQGYMNTFPVATYDGWYLDLFPSIDTALEPAPFVADYATFNRESRQGVHYLGAKAPRLGVFVVDTGGGPRMMVGPVASAFAYTGPLDRRLTDDDAEGVAGTAPWAATYTHDAPQAPALRVRFQRGPEARAPHLWRTTRPADRVPLDMIRIEAPADLGPIEIELLDHHFGVMRTLKVTAASGRTDVAVPKTPHPVEALRIRRGAFTERVDLSLEGAADQAIGPRS